MTINWFPGHMNKARKELASALLRTDVVIEILDARLPQSSQNPMLDSMRGDLPRLVLLNKCDLADSDTTRLWQAHFERAGETETLAIDATSPRTIRKIPEMCRKLAPGRRTPGKPVRVMVVGIPNVGKSTLINTLLGRRLAEVSNKPAITRKQKIYRLEGDIALSDTPGVLWPKLEDQTAALRLAASGAIGDNAFHVVEAAEFAAGYLAKRYPDLLAKRFNLESVPSEPAAVIDAIGRRRGCVKRGGVVDQERAASILLTELKSGKLGRLSFEEPVAPE